MGSMLCQDHKCSSGIRHFQRAVNPLDEPYSGWPSTSKMDNNVEKVRALVRSDCRLTVRMIVSELNLKNTTAHQILTQESAMRKLCAKIAPKNLTIGRMCVFIFWNGSKVTEISWRMWLQVTKHGSLSTIQKQKDKVRNGIHLHHHVRKKARMSKSKIKSMLICFFDSQGIVHTEFVPQGQTVNYCFITMRFLKD